jgi:uncharacterized protein YggE
VIAELKKLLGAKGEIKTAYYQLNPVYGEGRPGRGPTIAGYSASNTVLVSTEDMDKVGKVVDAATQSGANNIQSLQFMIKDDSALRKQALQEAVAKAKSKADAMASAAGVKLVRIVSINESGGVRPMQMRAYGGDMAMMSKAAAPTPIEAGDLDISAGVSIAYEIAP